MKKAALLTFIIFIVIFGLLFSAQRQKQEIPQDEHAVEVRLVLVDVIVTRDAEFVWDLSKDDFEIYEDGKKIAFDSFELISFEEREISVEEKIREDKPEPSPKKKLAVVFDGINSLDLEIRQNIDEIVKELVPLVQLGHEVMVCQLSETEGVEVLQPFTTKKQQITEAVKKASGNMWMPGQAIHSTRIDEWVREWKEDPLQHRFQKWQGRQGLEEPKSAVNDPEMLYRLQLSQFFTEEKIRFEKTMGGMLATVNMLRAFPGRKALLLISGGIPDLTPEYISSSYLGADLTHPGTENFQTDWETASRMRSHFMEAEQIRRIRIFDPFQLMEKKEFSVGEEVIRELINYANTQNISIYSLDAGIFSKYVYPGGSSAESVDERESPVKSLLSKERIKRVQNLRWLSEDTGADSLRGADKYDNFRHVMKTDLNYYYQLSFYPPRKKPDDKYHKLRVKVNRRGVDVRHRKGYTDYSREEEHRIRLITAFYNPSLFRDLPFEGAFIPFLNDAGEYEPWINIALPTEEIFVEKFTGHGQKKFHLHVWVNDRITGVKGYGGTISLPFNINSRFMEFIQTTSHLSYHFKGPEVTFPSLEYQAVIALEDPLSNEIGTWSSEFTLPGMKGKDEKIVNCVLGNVISSKQKGKSEFALSKNDGSLEYGQIKFFPKASNEFLPEDQAAVFFQLYLPGGQREILPELVSLGEDGELYPIPAELAAESWNKKTSVWSGIFKLNFDEAPAWENILTVKVSGIEGGKNLVKELKLLILR
ncbi:MAG: VWA domain-containing protein [Candidatus Aminicenantes bacterium]